MSAQPQINQTAAVVNFHQNFATVKHPTASLLHRQPGRSVRHNLLRLPSPDPTHDFRTSILLGGNHPQNQFRHLLEKHKLKQELDEAAHIRGETTLEGSSLIEDGMGEWGGPDDLAAYFAQGGPNQTNSPSRGNFSSGPGNPVPQAGTRAQSSLDQRRSPVVSNRTNSGNASNGGGMSAARSLQGSRQTATASSMLRRSMTPNNASQHSGTSAGAYLQGSKEPKDFVKKNIDLAFRRPMTQQANKTAMNRFEEKLKQRKQGDGSEFGDFSLQINGDYETPFVSQLPELEKPSWTTRELAKFERRQKGPRTLTTLPQINFSPPKVIIMMFRFSNVRNLRVTKALRRVGYPELHEQFSTTAKGGTITKVQFQYVCAKYLSAVDQLDCLRILECFDRNALGDVDLNMLLIGLQILLECAAPGDAMRFCFTLMDTANKIPRYITRYEVQTLVGYASAFAQDADAMDAEYLMMGKSIEELLTESQRYDYMGRMPLKEFLEALDAKVATRSAEAKKGKKQAQLHLGSVPGRGEGDRSQFMFGKAWSSGSGAVTAVHRMSSKKMIVASLTPGPSQ